MLRNLKFNLSLCAVVSFGMFLRASVSLHSYSGKSTPPMFGDFEAQRHWQEICFNLPSREWYRNSTDNDLMYWGLDYPPLTAYHSLLLGIISNHINDSYVALYKSRGISTDEHKHFMRTTVLVSDALIYIPSAIFVTNAISHIFKKDEIDIKKSTLLQLIIILSYPGQILIDNGHFQYNNMSLGLALFAIAFILHNNYIIAAIFFSLSLNYKQMELYHALPIFCILLAKSVYEKKKRIFSLIQLSQIGFAVVFTFVLLWHPWLYELNYTFDVFNRIFPVARGIFEDKVSNFWCILNVFVKIRSIFSKPWLVIICLFVTVLSSIPSSVHLILYPEKRNFLYSLVNVSLSFFLFSFQVHEKSILLVALPVMLLFPVEPLLSFWFLQISSFSILPLIVKDDLTVAFISLNVLFTAIAVWILKLQPTTVWREKTFLILYFKPAYFGSTLVSFCLFVCHLFVPPALNLPDIFPLVISAFSCFHFLMFLLYFNCRQIKQSFK